MVRVGIFIVCLVLGAIGGVTAARRASDTHDNCPSDQECFSPAGEAKKPDKVVSEPTDTEFVRMNNQFIVPVVRNDRVAAMVVLSLSLEVPTGETEAVFQRDPLLRDAFLQVLFDHAYAGGFDGAFTQNSRMRILRESLLDTAKNLLGPEVRSVLIVDIVRQEV